MELSDVFFDESPAPDQARAGGKFQPRAKQRPRKETSASVLSASAKVGTEESLKHNEVSSCRVGFDTPPSDVPVSDFLIWRKDVDLDQDPFEDVVNTVLKNVRAGGKFQPKAKPGPKKETSQPFLSAPRDETVGKTTEAASSGLELDAAQVVQAVDVADDIRNLGKSDGSQVVAPDAPSGLTRCDYSQFSTGKSVGEAADIFSELESLEPFLSQASRVTNANAGEKSHDTIDMDALPANKFDTSDSVSNSGPVFPSPLETVTLVASSNNKTVGESGIRAKNFDNFPAPRICDVTEEGGAFTDVENDDMVASGQHNGKFKPKHRSQRGKEKPSTSASQHAANESVMHPSNVQFVPSATECMEEGSVPVPPPDDVLDHSSMTLRDWMMLASRHESPTNKEPGNLPGGSNSDAPPSVDVPRMPSLVGTKKGRKNAPTESNLSQKSKKTASAANNEHEDKMYNGSIDDEAQPGSVNNDGEDVDGDGDHVESPSTRKRAPRKSKKPVIENEKMAQKHKKSNKASDQPAKEPSKKFSHSTRWKRRCVDKALLETDDIDFQKIAIKDLILFAEHKEQLEKKEAKASQVPMMNKSKQNSSHEEDAHNEESSFASEQAQESTDDQTGCTTQWNSLCLNYQSYMHKDPRARWSKQDTELFYKAIRQFGTDMSMIQQLFPGRTRHQIKLKFKNEERRYPMRISEAQASRAKDHSHFEKVIKQLQQVTAQAKQVSDREDSIGVAGEEEAKELAPETNEEITKTKQDQNVEPEDEAADAAEAHSPSKHDENDDDADMWDAYNNAF